MPFKVFYLKILSYLFILFIKKMENLTTNNQGFCENWPYFGSFLSSSSSNYESINDRNEKTYFPSFCLDLDASYEFDQIFHTNVFAAGLYENGKTLAIFEQDSSDYLNLHKFRFDKDLGSIHSKYFNTWLIRDYDYIISYDASFIVMFNSEELAHERDHRRRRKRGYGLGDKVFISILSFKLDFESEENSTKGQFFPNLYTLQLDNDDNDDESAYFWKYKHGYAIGADGTVIVSTWGVTTRETSEEGECKETSALYLNFFKTEMKDREVKLKHCGQRKIKCQDPSGSFEEPLIACNHNMTKIFFHSHNLVYNVDTNSAVDVVENAYKNTFWIIDDSHGEILLSLDRSNFSNVNVKVFKESHGNYVQISEFSASQIISNDNEPNLHCYGINNGTTRLFVQSTSSVIKAINPFSKEIDYMLDIQSNFKDPHVRKVLVSGQQILVLVWDNEREFVLCYNLKKEKNTLKSLRNLSAFTVLKNFSMQQIKSFGIPNVLLTFLQNNVYFV